jgi:hypothetical protein
MRILEMLMRILEMLMRILEMLHPQSFLIALTAGGGIRISILTDSNYRMTHCQSPIRMDEQ